MLNRRLYADDCLNVLNDPMALPDGSVDLIYLDPPFNSNSVYNIPFRSHDRNLRPVEAFRDTWEWGEDEEQLLAEFSDDPRRRLFAALIRYALEISGGPARANNLGAYLMNMAVRLLAMRRVLKDTGSLFLHCDPTASHYLKLLLDGIYGRGNFRNEIVWCYSWPRNARRYFARTHDILLFYSKGRVWTFNADAVRQPYSESSLGREEYAAPASSFEKVELDRRGKLPQDWIVIPPLRPNAAERLGYPTQKPLALLRHIIRAASNEGDLVLDPFCGCGTSVHAAELLNRRWVGIDISRFATGLIRERVLKWVPTLEKAAITVFGTPTNAAEARALARKDPFEFEKWVCGIIGAQGMYHDPGARGPDRGVDGVIEFWPLHFGKVSRTHYAIVQVKGGRVTPDAVGRLYDTVQQLGAGAGVLVCFADQLRTVENHRNRERFSDSLESYPVIQALAVEDLLQGSKPQLPSFSPRGGGQAPGRRPMFEK